MSRAQLFDIWKFVEIPQAKVIEKKLGGGIKKRTAWDFGASGDFHQPAFHQRLQNPFDRVVRANSLGERSSSGPALLTAVAISVIDKGFGALKRSASITWESVIGLLGIKGVSS